MVVNLGTVPVPHFDLYIGRDFRGYRDQGFGNPLRLRKDRPLERAALLVAYWDWLNGTSPRACAVRRRARAGELTGKVLGCWCAGKGICHGHLLAGVAAGQIEAVRRWVSALDQWSRAATG
jgi:hypothetical protein